MIGVRNYAIVTAAYWAFTLTDGALRLLVLLHFHELGYSLRATITGDGITFCENVARRL